MFYTTIDYSGRRVQHDNRHTTPIGVASSFVVLYKTNVVVVVYKMFYTTTTIVVVVYMLTRDHHYSDDRRVHLVHYDHQLYVCHVVNDEYNGGRVSRCTRRVYKSCTTCCTRRTVVVVVCNLVHDEYQLSICRVVYDLYSGRVSCFTRRV